MGTKERTTLTIDPGIHACGWALFKGKDLHECGWAKALAGGPISSCRTMVIPAFMSADTVVIEHPRVFKREAKGDVEDLILVAGIMGGLLADEGRLVEYVYPVVWKGSVPKKIMLDRIHSRLRPDELERIPDIGAKTHNVSDAVGIGLWKVGRL